MPRSRKSKSSEPLVVVSNRLPYNLPRPGDRRPPKRNVGGLVNAMEPVLMGRGGSWVGWGGVPSPSASAVASSLANPQVYRTPTGIDLYSVPVSDREIAAYYRGFSNRTLWPLLHGFTGKAVFSPEDYAVYERVNRRFAEVALANAGGNSRIWVQDFQLMLVPQFLREMGFRGSLDFFLHIPFPALEIFRALPWRRELAKGMLAADSVGFHIEEYRDNFVAVAEKLAGARVETESEDRTFLTHEGGSCQALASPIGIDVDDYERIARMRRVEKRAFNIRESHPNCRILFAADRLDYTKGITERLHSMERFLSNYPGAAGRVVLIQIVVPSRRKVEEYRVMKRGIDEEVGRINGQYGREGWVPIHYRYCGLDREELVSHYRAADVALVTPLRDGMNLVASEFAAARVDEDGILILSEFAGIAHYAPGSILLNPYDQDGLVRALGQAFTMEPEERKARMVKLRKQIHSNPVSRWAARCLRTEAVPAKPAARSRMRGRSARPVT